MKKSIFLFFAAILCAIGAKAFDQSAVDLYFDNSTSQWSECYVYIGHNNNNGWVSCYTMSRVSGTQYLWKLPANFNGGNNWGDATGWVVCKEKWWDSQEEDIYKFVYHGDKNVTNLTTNAWEDSKIYKADGTTTVDHYGQKPTVYKLTTSTKSDYTVTINAVTGGTLTVKDYDDATVSNGASKIKLTVLKFSAEPASGYVLEGVQINDGSTTTTISASEINTKTHTLTSNVTITPVWKATTSTVTVTTNATNGTVTGAGVYEEGTSVTLTATADAGYQFKNWTVAGAEVSTANPYTFTVNEDVTVTANFEELPKVTVYAINSVNWDEIAVHHWHEGGAGTEWPGDLMTNTGEKAPNGSDVYTATFLAEHENCIFNNNGNGSQTGTLDVHNGEYYDLKSNEWYASLAEVPTPDPLATDVFLVGSMNAWSTTANEFKKVEEGSATATLTMNLEAETVYEFKVVREGAWTSRKDQDDDMTITETIEGLQFSSSSSKNCKMKTNLAGSYIFTWEISTSKLSITYPASTEPDPTPDPAETETVYFVNADDWTGTIYAYAWKDGDPKVENAPWPGEVAQKEANQIGGHDVYSYTAEKGKYENVIFNNKNNGGNQQTADLAWTAGKYYVRDNWYTKDEAEAKLATPVEDVYTIVGSSELVGAHWDVNNTENDMIKQTDGSYVLTITNVELAVSGNYEYKVVKNRSWEWKEINGGNNITLTGVEEDGVYNITFTLTKELNALNVSLELVESKEIILDCFVAGDESLVGTGKGWTADAIKMVHDEGTKIYTATISNVPAGTHNMKVVYGGDWLGFDKLATPVPANVTEGDDNKIQFTLAEAGDVVVTYNVEAGIGLTGNFATPAPEAKKYYIRGSFNSWAAASADYELTIDGDVYKKEVTFAAGVEFKVTDGADAWWGASNLGGVYKELEGTDNIKMKEEKTFTIIFNPSENLITFEGLTEAETETLVYYVEVPEGTEDCYIAGQMNNWEFDQMTQVDATHWTITYDNVLQTTEYKYACQASWDYKELDKDGKDIANRTWTELDKVEKWAEPAEVKCYLMGNGDWVNGVEMEEDGAQFKLLAHHIYAPFKFKFGETWTADVENTDFEGLGSEDDGNGGTNITLPEGLYDFYFKKDTKKVYIALVGYARNVTNTYGTICLPYASASTAGATFFEVVGQEAGKVYLASVTELEAGVPYIFEKSASQIKVVYKGDKENAPVNTGANGLIGNFTNDKVVPAGNYILYNNEFRKSDGEAKVNAYRAYLDLSAVEGGKPTHTMPGRRYIGMSVQGENETTGVEDIFTTDAPVKVIENGQLIIIRDGVKYNVQGQKL